MGVAASRLPTPPAPASTRAEIRAKRSAGNQRAATTMVPISEAEKPSPVAKRATNISPTLSAAAKIKVLTTARSCIADVVLRAP